MAKGKAPITRTRPIVRTEHIHFRVAEDEHARYKAAFEAYRKLNPDGIQTFTDWAKAAFEAQIAKQTRLAAVDTPAKTKAR